MAIRLALDKEAPGILVISTSGHQMFLPELSPTSNSIAECPMEMLKTEGALAPSKLQISSVPVSSSLSSHS